MDWIGRGGGAGGRNDYVTNNAQTNELRKTRQTAGSKPNGTTEKTAEKREKTQPTQRRRALTSSTSTSSMPWIREQYVLPNPR